MKIKFLALILSIFVLFLPQPPFAQAEATKPTILTVSEKPITVDGKTSQAFDISQPDGTFGYYGKKGDIFDVTVVNKTRVPLTLHWHGIIDPNPDDGVPFVTQLPIQPGQSFHYRFKLKQAGTYWLHSHYQLQEQKLMAAPLIIYDPTQPKEPEALMFIQDFTFEDPNKIFEALRKKAAATAPISGRVPVALPMNPAAMQNMNMPSTAPASNQQTAPAATSPSTQPGNQPMSMPEQPTSTQGNQAAPTQAATAPSTAQGQQPMVMSGKDVTDVQYAAYLTNHKTLRDPDIIRVTPGQTLRLRVINASASSSYFIDLGKLTGTLIAIDGEPIKPFEDSRFQISIGNRLDIRIKIPEGEGAYPILALPEGVRQQTGLILATEHATIPTLSETTNTDNPILDNSQELKSFALQPYPVRPVKQSLVSNLEGNMKNYVWTMNGQVWPYVPPFIVNPNQRVEIVFNNKSGMPHPMHFHGHVFQVVEIDGKKFAGRKGDTFDVMPNSTVKFVFDTDNPGIWMLHCHILYHAAGGMQTTVNYKGYPDKFTIEQRKKGEEFYSVSPFPTKQ